jgi:hypothetical protein
VENVAILVAIFLGGIVSGFAGFAFSAVAGAILLHGRLTGLYRHHPQCRRHRRFR